jgi:hypothetical protein
MKGPYDEVQLKTTRDSIEAWSFGDSYGTTQEQGNVYHVNACLGQASPI